MLKEEEHSTQTRHRTEHIKELQEGSPKSSQMSAKVFLVIEICMVLKSP
jgi:hypothetical protein